MSEPTHVGCYGLAHNSKVIHRAYAKKAQVILPPLEEYEQKIVPLTNLTQREPVRMEQPVMTSVQLKGAI